MIRRVLFVVHAAAVGGMETLCVDLGAEFVRRGLRVAAVIPDDPVLDPLEDRFRAAGVAVARIDTRYRGERLTDAGERLRQIHRLRRYAGLLRRWRPDIVHLHTGSAVGGLAVTAVTRFASGATRLLSEHEVPVPRPSRYHRLAAALQDRLLDGLIAVSRRNAALRRARQPICLPPERFASILNGIPIREVEAAQRAANRAALRAAACIDADAVVIGCLVRLAWDKGLDDLLRAVALLNQETPCTLLLVGDGPLRSHLEALAATLGIAERVRFAGYQVDPLPFLDAMDIFALAVPSGSMSIALLEAMAAGLPPVITFCGPEEAVIPEETGLCAPPNDPDALAAALGRLVCDPALRARLGAAAAAHVRRHFTIARVADDHLAVYAAARRRAAVPARLHADAPLTPRPGDAGQTACSGRGG